MIHVQHPEENIICYHGPINIDLVSFASNYIKKHIVADASVVGKIYKVFIELTQNVSYYSAKQYSKLRAFGSGIGWFRVDEKKDHFAITTGNVILKEHGPILKKNCAEINSLGESKLRELKRVTRSQAGIRDIGAHIGLIQMGLITGNPLNLNIESQNENHSFFTITAKVNKRQTKEI
ncbi:MAG: SiaB family protein kinase [Bacteroidales bacterium]|nr:SiaB family protein kinase [Bacteroidales bacterium]